LFLIRQFRIFRQLATSKLPTFLLIQPRLVQ